MTKMKKTDQDKLFAVPEGYFDSFEDRLMTRVKSSGSVRKSLISKPMLNSWIGLAAAFLIVALVYNFLPRKLFIKETQNEVDVAMIIEQSAVDWFHEYELIEYLTSETDANIELYPDSLFFRDIDEDDLMLLSFMHF